jgi:hypothetical protein
MILAAPRVLKNETKAGTGIPLPRRDGATRQELPSLWLLRG